MAKSARQLDSMTSDELIDYNVELKDKIRALNEERADVAAVLAHKLRDEQARELLERAGLGRVVIDTVPADLAATPSEVE
jgi:hypothetical protein